LGGNDDRGGRLRRPRRRAAGTGRRRGGISAAAAGTVTGTGTARLERRPDLLRVQFELTAEGNTMKDALAQLRAKEKTAREKLAKLGAADAAVRVDEPRSAGGGDQDPQAQMNRMLRMRMGQGQNKPATGPAQPAAKVTARVRAEWKLPAGSADELLVAAQDLTAKIKTADLPAKGEKKALSPEEQEAAEEQAMMAQVGGQAGGGDELAPAFVSRVSEEDRAKLLAEAYGRAKRDAARLAKAAGSDLGPVRQVSAAAGGGDDASNPYSQMVRAQMAMMNGDAQQAPQSDDADAVEAVGTAPGPVTYQVSVSASFAIK
jgi:uncharacterized protein YggE